MQYQGFEATSSVAEAAPANSEVSNSSTGSSETVDSGYYDNDKTFFKVCLYVWLCVRGFVCVRVFYFCIFYKNIFVNCLLTGRKESSCE